MDCYQILLHLDPTSGRGVRYRMLSPEERDEVLFKSAKLAGDVNDRQKLAVFTAREGVKSMLVAVTKQRGLRSLNSADWHKVTMESLTLPGEWEYNKIFTAKDDEILSGIYMKLHNASREEVEMIAGKAQKVSMD